MFGMVHFGSMNTIVPTEQQQIGIEFVKLDTWTTVGQSDLDVTPNTITDTLTISKTGMYQVIFTVAFKGTNERDYTFSVFANGIEQPQIQTERFQGKNLVTFDVYGSGLIDITTVPMVLDVRVKCDVSEANVVIVERATFTCIEIINTDVTCKVTKSAAQTITNSVSTIITWDEEDYDTDNMHDNVTNNSRITIKEPGKYSVLAQFEWTSNSSGKRIIDIMKNGVVVGKGNYSASGNSQHTISFVGAFIVDDILEVRVFQDSGGSLDFLNNITYFAATRLTT